MIEQKIIKVLFLRNSEEFEEEIDRKLQSMNASFFRCVSVNIVIDDYTGVKLKYALMLFEKIT